jgi:signal transduction histidine kinase
MKERSEELGGTFEALWSEGHGTDIVATLPLVNNAVELGISDAGDRNPAGAHRG